MRPSKQFFLKPTIDVAKNLLGCYLIHETKDGIVKGKIVETEAYLFDDEASHSLNGKTKRNEAMFLEGGRAYVYFTYGMHFCFNVVTNKEGIGEAVLIRALEPIKGIEIMKERRRNEDVKNLCNGPAKLVEAMGILKEHNGSDLLNGNLRLEKGESVGEIIETKRKGISKAKDLNYRFYIKGNEFVSKK